MSSANDLSFPNHTWTKHPTQTHFYPGKIPGDPYNTATTATSNETFQSNLYRACADQGQMSANNASQSSSYGTYEDIVSPNRYSDPFRDRTLQSRFYDNPCFLQTGRDTSSTKHNTLSQDSPYKFPDRYSYNHVPPTNLYDKYTVSCNNAFRSNPYNPCWNPHSIHEVSHTNPYNVCTEQTNSKSILGSSPYNSYADQRTLTNVSQAPPYNSFTNHQTTQHNAYKTYTEQSNLSNALQNNFYDVFHQNTPQTDPYNMYLDQRDINRSTESNTYDPYKEDVSQTGAFSNAYTNQGNSARDHATQTTPYNACVNQTKTYNGSWTNQYGSHFANCFKGNNAVNNINTTPHNNFYRAYSDPCPTPTNPTPAANFYDSYTVPFSIALTHPASQSSQQTHHYQSPTIPLNTTRPRNRFPRQMWANRRLDFQDSNLDRQGHQYVVMRQFIPERYDHAKQPKRIPQLPQVSPKTIKGIANELSAVAITKIKHRSAPQRLGNVSKKPTVGPERRIETTFQSFIIRQDVLLSSHVIDDDDGIPEIEGASLKKRGRPLKKISSRLLKFTPKPFRDAGKSRTKKSPKWDKRPSEKVTLKTKPNASSVVDVYLWTDDFILEEVNDVERSPSSLFLRPKSSDVFEKDPEIIKEPDFEESVWPRSGCQLEIDDMKPAWKILMLESIFPDLIY